MKKVILIRAGEILLKGLNRGSFEDKLLSNIKKNIYGLGKIEVRKSQARYFVEPENEDYDYSEACDKIKKVFGIVSLSVSDKIEIDIDNIKKVALEQTRKIINEKGFSRFKVETKRGDKNFPMTSPEFSGEIGWHILENTEGLVVDVKNPQFIIYIEIRDYAYIYSEKIPSFGGMPIGTNGKSLLLLSGGIDSPVAGWMLAKRGVQIDCIHFYSYPYTSVRSKEKVIELARIMSYYCGQIRLHIVPFTDIQVKINDESPEDHLTLIMRRYMMKIAERVAKKTGSNALITGESMGQVASQTMQSIVVTDDATNIPVFRPLIGMDKNEVIDIARKIDTYETSILPYEDCCTVFVAKHPKTKPRLESVLKYEEKISGIDELVDKAYEEIENILIINGKVIEKKQI